LMSDDGEIVITLDSKKIIGLSVLALLSFVVMSSYIVALLGFIAPSQDVSLTFNTPVATHDIYYYSQSGFARGSTVKMKVTYEMATDYYNALPYYYTYYSFIGSASYRLIITVVDSVGRPAYIGSTSGSLTSGETEISDYFDFVIPSNAATGAYTVKAYLWSDWLPGGIARAQTPASGGFNVS